MTSNKTAILFIGYFGTTLLTIKYLYENLIKPNKCDVFIITFKEYYINIFDRINISNKFFINEDDIKYIKDILGDSLKMFIINNNNEYDNIYDDMYQSILTKVQEFMKNSNDSLLFYDNNENKFKDYKRYIEQYYLNKIAFNIMENYANENNIKYDYCIRARSDCLMYEKIILPNFNDEYIFYIGNINNEWCNTAFFGGSIKSMKYIMENTLDYMFRKPILNNSETLYHEVQFGCVMYDIYKKLNFKLINLEHMFNILKLNSDNIQIRMGPFYTNEIYQNEYYINTIKKYTDSKDNIILRTYIFLKNSFWINSINNYKEIENFFIS
jgi:hypothetical protein